MNLQLENKFALVTGSTAGIGFAIAKALAAEGARVIVNGRSEARVTEAIAAIRGHIPSARLDGLALDLCKADAAMQTIKRFPDVDILVNNLGVYQLKPFEQITDAEWSDIIETNVLSGVRLSRHLSTADENGRLGTHYFHLQRIRREHSGGNDPLWRDEKHASGARPRTGRNHTGNRCDGQFGAGWPDPFGRRGKVRHRHGEIEKRHDCRSGKRVLPHGETKFSFATLCYNRRSRGAGCIRSQSAFFRNKRRSVAGRRRRRPLDSLKRSG